MRDQQLEHGRRPVVHRDRGHEGLGPLVERRADLDAPVVFERRDEVGEFVEPPCRADRGRPVAHDVGKRHHGGEVTSWV